ncbi:MAG: ferritin-like domain-containing protein, partial [Rhodospirillales bacterium]
MGNWTLDNIPWDDLDPARIDPDIVPVIKAASLVERNAADYVSYLHNVFADDDAFRAEAIRWGQEEEQHGDALGQWAERADPGFDYAAS